MNVGIMIRFAACKTVLPNWNVSSPILTNLECTLTNLEWILKNLEWILKNLEWILINLEWILTIF